MGYNKIKHWCLAFFILLPPFAMASESEIYTRYFSNLAVEGYDTVAYFDQNKPVQGQAKYSYKYKGAVWQFSTQENLDKFVATPKSTHRSMAVIVRGRWLTVVLPKVILSIGI
jgi:YHS domain-containing protein